MNSESLITILSSTICDEDRNETLGILIESVKFLESSDIVRIVQLYQRYCDLPVCLHMIRNKIISVTPEDLYNIIVHCKSDLQRINSICWINERVTSLNMTQLTNLCKLFKNGRHMNTFISFFVPISGDYSPILEIYKYDFDREKGEEILSMNKSLSFLPCQSFSSFQEEIVKKIDPIQFLSCFGQVDDNVLLSELERNIQNFDLSREDYSQLSDMFLKNESLITACDILGIENVPIKKKRENWTKIKALEEKDPLTIREGRMCFQEGDIYYIANLNKTIIYTKWGRISYRKRIHIKPLQLGISFRSEKNILDSETRGYPIELIVKIGDKIHKMIAYQKDVIEIYENVLIVQNHREGVSDFIRY